MSPIFLKPILLFALDSMPQSSQTIPTPVGRQVQRGLKRWMPGVCFLAMCVVCIWLSQFQNQNTLLIGEVEVSELVVTSPQTGIVNRILPDLQDKADLVYSTVKAGQLILRLDDGTVRQQLDELQTEMLSLSQSVAVELARIDSISNATKVVVSAETKNALPEKRTTVDADKRLANELQAWRLGATTIERQLKQVELTRQQLELREVEYRLTNSEQGDPHSDSDTSALANDLPRRKSELELAVAKLNTDLAFDGTALASDKLLSKIDESGLSAAGRSLFRSFRRRCQLVQSQLAATMKSAATLDTYSPIDGQIENTYTGPLQSIEMGGRVLSVIPSHGAYVIGYARELSVLRPFVGMPVVLRSPVDPTHRFESTVESVGPKIESIPSRQRVNSRMEEWGRPVRIPIPREMAVQPGSVLEIIFVGHHGSE